MLDTTLRLSNGRVLVKVPDQQIDRKTTSLTLVGRGAVNYGADFSDNFLKLLETFAHTAPPAHPLIGQLWFDTSTAMLRLWNGQTWRLAIGDVSSKAIPYTLVLRDEHADFAARYVTADLIGNATTASKWQSSRVLTFTNNVSGSATVDGSENVTIPLTVNESAHAARATTADRLTSSFVLTLSGEASGAVTIDGSAPVTLNTTIAATPNSVPGAIMRRNGEGDVAARNFYGVASSASRWETPRTLTLTGHVNGAVTFDGNGNMSLNASVVGMNATGVAAGIYNNARVNVGADGRIYGIAETTAIQYANEAGHAARADRADYANDAAHAAVADRVAYADRAGYADNAGNAANANNAAGFNAFQIAISGAVSGAANVDGRGNVNIGVSSNIEVASLGGAHWFYAGRSGNNLAFKTLAAGNNVTIEDRDNLLIVHAGGGGSTTIDGSYKSNVTENKNPAGSNIAYAYPGGQNTFRSVSRVLWQYDVDLNGASTYLILANQVGSYAANGSGVSASQRIATAVIEIIVDGQVVASGSTLLGSGVAANYAVSGPSVQYAGVVPASKRVTVRCTGTVGCNNANFDYTYGEGVSRCMRFG